MSSSSASEKPVFTRPLASLGGVRPAAPDWFERSIAVRSEEGSVEVEGAKITYSAWGEIGKPGLLFIHGGRAHRNWWRPFAPFFADDHRVAALDISGMGDSGWREEYCFETLADEVFAVVEAAKLNRAGRPIVIGHSFGGYVTLAAVEKGGNDLGGAVVIDSPLGVPDPNEGYVIKSASTSQSTRPTMRVYKTLEEPVSRFRFLPDQSAEHLYLLDYIAREGVKQVDGPDGPGWSWKFDPHKRGNFNIQFEREILRASRCPLAFIYGEKSAFATKEAIGHIQEQAKGRSPFVMMPGAHHHLMMDQPIAFISMLRTLLSCWPVRVGG